MKSLLFGPAGIPTSTPKSSTANGIAECKRLGLGSMEIEFVRSINVTEKTAPEVKKAAKDNDIVLTCHGQYWVNLNAKDKAILDASKQRIIDACRRCSEIGVWSICYHMAFYMGMPKDTVYKNVSAALKDIKKVLDDEGIKIWLRPETGGKVAQFGEIDEMIKLSQEFDGILPCIDWAHHHARSNGKFNTYDEFASILEAIEKGLGKEALQNMHCHTEGIQYNEKGEQYHLNLDESDFNYKPLVKAWKDYKIKGVITCESPNIEKDALKLKKEYDKF